MKRISRAYETKDGKVFKTKKDAGEHELVIERSRLATKWFQGYVGDLIKVVRGWTEFREDFIEFNRLAKKWAPEFYGKEKDEEEEEEKIPF